MLTRHQSIQFVRLMLLCGVFLMSAAPSWSQSISYISFEDEIGSGLQSRQIRARLSDSQHGGITVRIESADTNLAFVTDDDLTPGSEFIDIFVPNGSTDATFYIQALEDTTGVVTITASAPGFPDGVDDTDIVTPWLRFSAILNTIDVPDPDNNFRVDVGLPNSNQTGLSTLQKVRVGGPGLTATVSHTNPAAAELITTALTGQVVSVAIAPGESTSPTSVANGGVAINGIAAGSTQVTASIPGFSVVSSIPYTVNINAASISFTNLPEDVGAGLQVASRRARLNGNDHGGVIVTIVSADSALALVSPGRYDAGSATLDIFVPNGQTDAVFYVQGLEDTTGTVTLSASSPGFDPAISSVTVMTPYFRVSNLSNNIDTLDPDDPFTLTVGLPSGTFTVINPVQQARGGGPGIDFIATSSNGAVGLLTTTVETNDSVLVTVLPGESATEPTVTSGGVAFSPVAAGTTQVTATRPGFLPVSNAFVDVVVTEPGITFTGASGVGIGAGLQNVFAYDAVLSAAQHGGVTVHLEVADTNLALISGNPAVVGGKFIDVFVPNGSTDAEFWLQGKEDTTGVILVTATAPGFSVGMFEEDLIQPSVRIHTDLAGSIDTIDPPDEFRVRVGTANAANFFSQDVRAGAPPLPITLSVDAPSVGTLLTLADTGDVLDVFISSGESFSASTVATGGIAFDGLSVGSTNVFASSPGYISQPQATRTVTVNAPTISLSNVGRIGAGLQEGAYNATLSASAHGGVTVRIESDSPGVALIAPDGATGGSTFIDVFVANGSTQAPFYVQGIDGAVSGFNVVATAPGFVTSVDSAEIVQPGVEIRGLNSSRDVVDPPDDFYARVGLPNNDNSTVQLLQERRAGAPALIVEFVSSNGVVGEFTTTGGDNDTISLPIPSGEDNTPTSIATGGLGFVGLSSGQTLVTSTIPGFILTGDGQVNVDVSNQNIFLNGLTARLGSGLQSSAASAELGEPNHGGTTVTIAVDDPSFALISTNALVTGGSSVNIPLANGETEALFYLQALDSTDVSVSVTATAASFASAQQDVDIVAAGVEIFALADTVDATAADDEFVVRIGAVNADSSGIVEGQGLRGGNGARTLTVDSSDPSLASIVLGNQIGPSQNFTINEAQFETPLTVGSGGYALSPWNNGTLTVSATVPGVTTTANGARLVTIVGGTATATDALPKVLALQQNVPNPFNPTTTITYSLPRAGQVTLSVYDVAGRRIATLVDSVQPAGTTSVGWSGRNHSGQPVASGVYFYRLVTEDRALTRKMLLLK